MISAWELISCALALAAIGFSVVSLIQNRAYQKRKEKENNTDD